MRRRDFVKKGMFSAAMVSLPSCVEAASGTDDLPARQDFHLLYAPHFGMFKSLAGDDLLAQLNVMAQLGFKALEDNNLMSRPKDLQVRIGETLAKLGMQMGVFVIAFDQWPLHTSLTSGQQEWKDKFLTTCREAVEVAKRVNARWMTVVPGNFDRTQSLSMQTAHVIEVLRQAAGIFEPHNLTMVLEPLSDTPDLFLRHSDQTYMICKAVNSPACKLLFDMYHMQRNEGDIIMNLERTWDEIAYLQIGDNPGRKEPTTGEMNYKNIFKHIYQKGWKGILGMEHGNATPGKEGEIALFNAYKEVDSFLLSSSMAGKKKK